MISEDFDIPDRLLFTEDYLWVDLKKGKAKIGLTPIILRRWGQLRAVELPRVGEEVSRGQIIGSIEARKTRRDLYAPISGLIENVNRRAQEDVNIISSDPYGEGWLLIIEPVDLEAELGYCLTAKQFAEFLRR
ncbi:MAG: glycine cleavage system protein H [Candidatus Bathyarchaeia archaeon]